MPRLSSAAPRLGPASSWEPGPQTSAGTLTLDVGCRQELSSTALVCGAGPWGQGTPGEDLGPCVHYEAAGVLYT